nr:hypothetical protein [Tanacetum cinerariifolium]
MREKGCASWDRGHSTWGGRAALVPEIHAKRVTTKEIKKGPRGIGHKGTWGGRESGMGTVWVVAGVQEVSMGEGLFWRERGLGITVWVVIGISFSGVALISSSSPIILDFIFLFSSDDDDLKRFLTAAEFPRKAVAIAELPESAAAYTALLVWL